MNRAEDTRMETEIEEKKTKEGEAMDFFMMDVETGQKIDLSGGITELTFEVEQEEPAAGAQLYTPLLGEQFEIILEAKIPTLPRRWRRPYVRKFGYRWAKRIARGRRLAKVKERWKAEAEFRRLFK